MNAPMQVSELRLPPHSIEAEQAVIGGLLLESSAWDRIGDMLTEDDFYRDDHRRIFGHIRKLCESGRVADVVTVFGSIEKSNEVEQTSGLQYLGEIAANTPSAANIRRYAEIVRERSILRSLVKVGDEIAGTALNPGGKPVAEILDQAEAKVYAIAESKTAQAGEPELIRRALGAFVERLQEQYDNDGAGMQGVSTGFAQIDDMTHGLKPGNLIIIAGRPSMGKTAFALNIAEHVAVEQELPVLVFSLEMSAEELAMRSTASVGQIDLDALQTGRMADADWDKMTVALGKMHDAPLIIDETAGITISQMRAKARREARKRGRLGLIIVDYLQLMTSGKGDTRAEDLSNLTRSLKLLARELGVPLIALSQLSRKVEERNDKRPMLSDLRESGSIEQDADLVVMMYRDEYYKPDSPEKGLAEAIIAKQRMGKTGTARLVFKGEHSKFLNPDQQTLAEAWNRARAPKEGRKERQFKD